GRLHSGQAPAQQASRTCSSPSICHKLRPTPPVWASPPFQGQKAVRDRDQGDVVVPAHPAAPLEVVQPKGPLSAPGNPAPPPSEPWPAAPAPRSESSRAGSAAN